METNYTSMALLESQADYINTGGEDQTTNHCSGISNQESEMSNPVQDFDVHVQYPSVTEGVIHSRPRKNKVLVTASNKIPLSIGKYLNVDICDTQNAADSVGVEDDLISEDTLRSEVLIPLNSMSSNKLSNLKTIQRTLGKSSQISDSQRISLSSPPSSTTGSSIEFQNPGFRQQSKVSFEMSNPSSGVTNRDITYIEDSDRSSTPEVNVIGGEDEEALIQADRNESRKTNENKSQYPKRTRQLPRRKLERLRSQLDLEDLSRNELKLKANLFFLISNPIKRWRVERVVPMKLLLQLLKTFCLIVQVVLFQVSVTDNRIQFFIESRTVFESLFIESFDKYNCDTKPPPNEYTTFTILDMHKQFQYIADQYYSIPDITIGSYGHMTIDDKGTPFPLTMVLERYKVADLNVSEGSYVFNGDIEEITFTIMKGDNASQVYTENSEDPQFSRFVNLGVIFPIKMIRITHSEKPECYLFQVTIYYWNEEKSGLIHYRLTEEHTASRCNNGANIISGLEKRNIRNGAVTTLDGIIIIMCCLSIFLTISSVRRAFTLGKAMGKFYQKELGIKLSWWERRHIFSLWHVVNTASDFLILAGTIYNIFLSFSLNDLNEDVPTRVLLGTAILFQAGVILRYVFYFKELNVLSRTLRLAFPELLKFSLCASILFIAFAFTGWIVLGTYHEKFATMIVSIESLFSLLNGDDIYTTFDIIKHTDDPTTYIYSRLFLFIFLFLFLYAILNIFTSLVITAYDTSKVFDTAYENEVRRFVFSGPLTPGGVALRDVTLTKKYVEPKVIKLRLRKKKDIVQCLREN